MLPTSGGRNGPEQVGHCSQQGGRATRLPCAGGNQGRAIPMASRQRKRQTLPSGGEERFGGHPGTSLQISWPGVWQTRWAELPRSWKGSISSPSLSLMSYLPYSHSPSPYPRHKHDYVQLLKLTIAFIFLFSTWPLKPVGPSNLKPQWREKHS